MDAKGVTFVKPELVGEVRYSERTSDGRLRQPSWRGLRPDKGPTRWCGSSCAVTTKIGRVLPSRDDMRRSSGAIGRGSMLTR